MGRAYTHTHIHIHIPHRCFVADGAQRELIPINSDYGTERLEHVGDEGREGELK